MAILGSRNPTYRDVLSGLKKDGSRDSDIVELYTQVNEILDDLVVVEANDGSTNLSTIRTGLPKATWVGLYEGPQPSKGSKAQVKDACGTLESLLEIDEKLYDLAPEKEGYLLDEAAGHVEAQGQELGATLVYGSVAANPRSFNGLMMRYANVSKGEDQNESPHYVLDAFKSGGSTAALRSIWLVSHGKQAVHGFYPKGTQGGIKRGQLELVWNEDTTHGKYKVVRQLFRWYMGLTVKDFRYAGRIANIESDRIYDANQTDYIEQIRRLETRVRKGGLRQTWYMSKPTLEALYVLCSRKTQENAIRSENLFERQITSLYGTPIRIIDALETNEPKALPVA